MPISFPTIPTDTRVPFVFVEFDSSRAQQGPSLQPFQGLVIGQRLATGSVAALSPVLVTSAEQAAQFFGLGSNLHNMAQVLFKNDNRGPYRFVALDDQGGGTQATGTFTVTGTATENGTVFAYIAGRRFEIGVTNGDAASAVALAIEAAINADTSLPVTAGVVGGVVTFTARHKGTVGNQVDIRLNYNEGEQLPAGVAIAVAAMSSGATDPDVSTALAFAVLGDEHYNVLISHLATDAALDDLEAHLAAQWGPLVQKEGVVFACLDDSHANLITAGDARNSPHSSVMGVNASPTPAYEWAAAIGATVMRHGKIDPARPFQTLPLREILPPAESDRFTTAQRDLLLHDGIATHTVDAGGLVRVQRLITTYQENAAGAPDIAYLDVNTLLTLGYLRFDTRTRLLLRYPRHKLANDGTKYGVGQAIVTPKTIRGELLGFFRDWEELGLVEGYEQFADELIVERSATDPNRIDILMPPDLVNQLRVSAVLIQFLL